MPLFHRRQASEAHAAETGGAEARLEATVSGMVQGVGFRYWTLGEAEKRGLVGSAGNQPDGTVRIIAEGARGDIEGLLGWLRSGETPGRVEGVEATLGPVTGEFSGFSLY